MTVLALFFVGVTLQAGGGVDAGLPHVAPELPVTPEIPGRELANNSPSVAVDPTDRRFVALASRIDGPDYGCMLHLSGDGGRGWVPATPIEKIPEGVEKCYSPSVVIDNQGVLYYLFSGLAGPNNAPMGVFLTASRDKGGTFSEPRRVLPRHSYMVQMEVSRTGRTEGRIHVVWVQPGARPAPAGFSSALNRIMTKFSDDGGETFSQPVQASDPERLRVVRPSLAVGEGGALHVLYYDLKDDVRDYMGLEGPTSEEPWELVIGSSTNGGETFRQHSVMESHVVPPERIMLIFNAPPPALTADENGNVYGAWWDGRNGDWDVFLRTSRDQAQSWGEAVRVNDDELRNGRHQYLPALATAPNGRLDVAFYDRRSDSENVRNHVSYAYSQDEGRSFSSNIRLTAEPSDSRVGVTLPGVPSAKGLYEFGSQPALASGSAQTLAAWTDTRWSRGEPEQHIVATQVVFPRDEVPLPEKEAASQPWVLVAAAALVVTLSGLMVFALSHRRADKARNASNMVTARVP